MLRHTSTSNCRKIKPFDTDQLCGGVSRTWFFFDVFAPVRLREAAVQAGAEREGRERDDLLFIGKSCAQTGSREGRAERGTALHSHWLPQLPPRLSFV